MVLHETPSKHLTWRSFEMRSEKREASFPILIILEDKLASSTSAHDMIDVRFADPSCSPHSSPHPLVLAHDYTTRATSERIHFYNRDLMGGPSGLDVNSTSVPLFTLFTGWT